MNKNDLNDLSDEAMDNFIGVRFQSEGIRLGWREAVRRAKANPWALFRDDLDLINQVFARADGDIPCGLEERQLQLWDEIKAELERRKRQ